MNDLKAKRVKYPIHPAGEDATAFIAALLTRLTKQKNGNGATIALFFCYASQAGKTTLKAVQLIILG